MAPIDLHRVSLLPNHYPKWTFLRLYKLPPKLGEGYNFDCHLLMVRNNGYRVMD